MMMMLLLLSLSNAAFVGFIEISRPSYVFTELKIQGIGGVIPHIIHC
jgi:hypothetical protein